MNGQIMLSWHTSQDHNTLTDQQFHAKSQGNYVIAALDTDKMTSTIYTCTQSTSLENAVSQQILRIF